MKGEAADGALTLGMTPSADDWPEWVRLPSTALSTSGATDSRRLPAATDEARATVANAANVHATGEAVAAHEVDSARAALAAGLAKSARATCCFWIWVARWTARAAVREPRANMDARDEGERDDRREHSKEGRESAGRRSVTGGIGDTAVQRGQLRPRRTPSAPSAKFRTNQPRRVGRRARAQARQPHPPMQHSDVHTLVHTAAESGTRGDRHGAR